MGNQLIIFALLASMRLAFPAQNRGVCHGLAGYFETVLYGDVELSTNPVTCLAYIVGIRDSRLHGGLRRNVSVRVRERPGGLHND
jgi:hypothetical protein